MHAPRNVMLPSVVFAMRNTNIRPLSCIMQNKIKDRVGHAQSSIDLQKNDNSIKHWVLLYHDLCIKTFQSIFFFFFFQSSHQTLPCWFPCLFFFFAPSTCNNFPLRQKPSLDSFKCNLFQNCRPAMCSVPCCCLHPSQVSVCGPF